MGAERGAQRRAGNELLPVTLQATLTEINLVSRMRILGSSSACWARLP
jgi:hypothetical protein